jgi:hypothetical protein
VEEELNETIVEVQFEGQMLTLKIIKHDSISDKEKENK